MYAMEDVARDKQREMLEQAQLRRTAWRVQALKRIRRREARAERQMCQARVDATRLRWELEAEA